MRSWLVHVRPREGFGPLEYDFQQSNGTDPTVARIVRVRSKTSEEWTLSILT